MAAAGIMSVDMAANIDPAGAEAAAAAAAAAAVAAWWCAAAADVGLGLGW